MNNTSKKTRLGYIYYSIWENAQESWWHQLLG